MKQFLHCWKRYIDDIFLIFSGSYEELDRFHHDRTQNSCNFLDLTIRIEISHISTDLYRKETDKPTALLPSSAHPGHITPNIVYSLGFRLLRICSDEEKFEERLTELKNDFLKPRNYKPKLIDAEFEKVRAITDGNYEDKRR